MDAQSSQNEIKFIQISNLAESQRLDSVRAKLAHGQHEAFTQMGKAFAVGHCAAAELSKAHQY